MPDEVERPVYQRFGSNARDLVIDATDELMHFARHYPALMKDGYPLSWRVFRLAMRQENMERARFSLDMCRAMAAAQTTNEQREEWVKDQTRAAGYENG